MYPILRVGPDEAYHEMDVCTTGVLACVGTCQPHDTALVWLDGRESSWLAHLSSAWGRSTCGVHPSGRKAYASPLPSTVYLVVVCSSQLVSAFAAQYGTGGVVVVERVPRVCADHRLALGALAVAGGGSRMAGAVSPAGVARWVLAVVARTAHAGSRVSVSDAISCQVRGRSGLDH